MKRRAAAMIMGLVFAGSLLGCSGTKEKGPAPETEQTESRQARAAPQGA